MLLSFPFVFIILVLIYNFIILVYFVLFLKLYFITVEFKSVAMHAPLGAIF